MAEIIPATAQMVRLLHSEPLPRTIRAIAAVEGDELIGITGFYPENGHLVLFGDMAPAARAEVCRHKRTMIRCAWKVMGMAMKYRMPIAAIADPKIPGSDNLLLHFGFAKNERGIYQWLG